MNLYEWGLVTAQLLVAVLCGGLIGYQRETLDRPAGFRTHILVCVGSAIYMLISIYVAGGSVLTLASTFDPGRIAAQVASGIGFLGAGTIIKQGSVVRGLTTAASLWAVAGVGLAAGFGRIGLPIAVLGTLIVYLSLTLLRRVERSFEHSHTCTITLMAIQPEAQMTWVRDVLTANGLELLGLAIEPGQEGLGTIHLTARAHARDDMERAVAVLAQGAQMRGVRWECPY